MAHLLYSAKDRQGRAVQGFVEAAATADAREELMARGLSDVVLHQEAALATDARDIAGLDEAQARELARISISAMRRPGLLPLLGDVARNNRGWLLFDAALAGWGAYSGSRWLLASGLGLALLPFALAIWQYRHGGRYLALVKSFSIGEWDRVQELAAKLRVVSASRPTMDFDLDVRLACIVARRDGLAPAVAALAAWPAKLADTPGVYEGRLASVHAAAGDRDGYVRLMQASYEYAPSEPSRILDLALAHARFGDAKRAGELMQTLDASLLPPHGKGFVHWVDGLVRLRTGAPGGLDELQRGVAEFLKLASQPAVWTSLAFCTCDHAVALALAGSREAARAELAQVWTMVRAHADKPLLRMLQADGLAPN
ncbi:hypothetical protein FN976_08465 [Caenimonas sedimenti]|uniref:Tetratricopeptide repeat protein n=1 Tax=Caenimonas sedimenti TaxID=2596921 RepID=A0A562ZST1_9BURK|nr:hypothetical protein [Caenimonas sedimenti]TWO71639.1 hypothetical protein FN976_08465 [Caenimonas sedimenti]